MFSYSRFKIGLGKALKEQRQQRKMSMKQVALLACLKPNTVTNVETGMGCNLKTLAELCRVLEIRVGDVVNYADQYERMTK